MNCKLYLILQYLTSIIFIYNNIIIIFVNNNYNIII